MYATCDPNLTLTFAMKGISPRLLFALAGAAIFLVGCEHPTAPVPPGPPVPVDPVTQVSIPGAYGVEGGDEVLAPSRQSGVYITGKTFSYRILDPASLTVVSLSGLPVSLQEGNKISVHYRLQRAGRTLESKVYENVEILLTNGNMAWLKESDQIFFVIQLM